MGRKRIFIVEDDPTNAELFETYLQENFSILIYLDGSKAKQDLENGLSYDLAIFDLSLPYQAGLELIQYAKKLHPTIPIWTMSGYDFQHESIQRHCIKPFRLEYLLRIIEEQLR